MSSLFQVKNQHLLAFSLNWNAWASPHLQELEKKKKGEEFKHGELLAPVSPKIMGNMSQKKK